MAREITATPEQLYGDGRYAAKEALLAAKRDIDDTFGEGYARNNPQLTAAFLSAAVQAGSSENADAILQDALMRIADSLSQIADAISEIAAASFEKDAE